MVFAINAPTSGETFDAFLAKAKNGTTTTGSGAPPPLVPELHSLKLTLDRGSPSVLALVSARSVLPLHTSCNFSKMHHWRTDPLGAIQEYLDTKFSIVKGYNILRDYNLKQAGRGENMLWNPVSKRSRVGRSRQLFTICWPTDGKWPCRSHADGP